MISLKKVLNYTTGATALALGATLAISGSASAVTFGFESGYNSWDGADKNLDQIASDYGIDDIYNQSSVQTFTSLGNLQVDVLTEIASNWNVNTFGIYDVATGETFELFGGTYSFWDAALSFDTVPFETFGFYIGSAGDANNPATNYYSEASKNPGGEEQFAIYQTGENEWTFAIEDLFAGGFDNYTTDNDYNDMIVKVSGIAPGTPTESVPEPATLLGLSLVGGSLLLSRRRKSLQES
ncbi:MAG: DUF4114 domain-containing protein [Oscillatoria sp. PMC 1068.18]|nr:DUF4114 domain-containing protein [Oscillatoria sp. PMC 1076.18]MEC4990107.1 DUF4114 domain-containing protein [Oscillatoria sp. PMC 1068.18]